MDKLTKDEWDYLIKIVDDHISESSAESKLWASIMVKLLYQKHSELI